MTTEPLRSYTAGYRGKKIEVQAATSYAAQMAAAAIFKAKKSYDVWVVLNDVPVDPASLG
ncbi:hypothetical protein [Microcystis phage Mwe-JY26]